jgi:cathepsin B
MARSLALTIALVVCGSVLALAVDMSKPVNNEAMIRAVNTNPMANWIAGANPYFEGRTLSQIKGLMGVKRSAKAPKLPIRKVAEVSGVPTSFDSRSQWGSICPSVSEIRDQAACGSCWAFGAVEAMTDRTCIASNGASTPHLSAEDMLSCCTECGDGCDGGDPAQAWQYWVDSGVVTGGNYDSNEGCLPYQIPGCDHHVNGSLPPCGSIVPTPPCPDECVDSEDWQGSKHFGSTAYVLSGNATEIQVEIMTNGPVEAAFDVYEDFLTYKSGVYHYVSGDYLGGHAVKILGWGVLSGTKYWLVANSWNTDWGDSGYFKIRRGTDECGIEDYIVGGEPASTNFMKDIPAAFATTM